MEGWKQVRRALLSVTDKSGLADFAGRLADLGVELVSTGGTAKALRDAGLTVRDVSDLTGFPEMLDGRVKTLHPKVHGGILHQRDNPEHQAAVIEHAIPPIDLVVVNLYPFEKVAAKPGASLEELIENIDIGGPSMLRSAAKNFADVAVVTSPEEYSAVGAELASNAGRLSQETRWRLARQAFAATAAYDTAIASTLAARADEGAGRQASELESTPTTASDFPALLHLDYRLANSLRYGENPHQSAALYIGSSGRGVAAGKPLQGKELSFNNLVDLDACWGLVGEFEDPAVAIIKHTNPSGVATAASLVEAYRKALASDPVSAFGSVIGSNREVDDAAAEEMAKLFVEAIAAPSFSEGAKVRFSAKKNLRLVEVRTAAPARAMKQISGGMLLQDADTGQVSAAELKMVTQRRPTPEELSALLFAWRVVKHVKSNAIVYARDGQTIGIGAGQMSRIDAARFGAMKAILPLEGSVAASDAFFPFPDGLEAIAAAGATAIIQPGGSVRDGEVIAAADRLGMAMAFTGMRHFRH